MKYFETSLSYFIEVNICVVIFYLIYVLLFKKETFFNLKRAYLLGIILLSFLIPFLQIDNVEISPQINPYLEIIPSTVEKIITISAIPHIESELPPNAPIIGSSKPRIPIHLILLYVYSFISTLLFFKLIKSIWTVLKTIKNSKLIRDEAYTIVLAPEIKSPYSFFKYLFWNDTFNDQDYLLKHEEIHMKQYHSADVLVYEFLNVIFWINPFISLLRKEAKLNLEHIADAFTDESNKEPYVQLLLKFVNRPSKISVGNKFNSEIKNRISMMYTKQSKKYKLLNFVFLIPVLIGMALLFSFQHSPASNLSKQNNSGSEQFQFLKMEQERKHPFQYEVHFGDFKFYIQKQRKDGSGVTFVISDKTASELMQYKPMVYNTKTKKSIPLVATYHSLHPFGGTGNTLNSLDFNHNENTHKGGKELLLRDIQVEGEDQLYSLSFGIFYEDKIKVKWDERKLNLNQIIKISKTEFIEKAINVPIQSVGYYKMKKLYFKEIEINKASNEKKVIALHSFPIREQTVLEDVMEKIIRNIEVGDKITLKEIRIESPSVPSTYWITFEIGPDDPNTKYIPPSTIEKNKITYLLNGEISDEFSIKSLKTDQILEINYLNKYGEKEIRNDQALIISVKTKK